MQEISTPEYPIDGGVPTDQMSAIIAQIENTILVRYRPLNY